MLEREGESVNSPFGGESVFSLRIGMLLALCIAFRVIDGLGLSPTIEVVSRVAPLTLNTSSFPFFVES